MMQKLISFSFVFVFVFAALGLTIPSARAAILTVDGSGQLTGATNVDLGSLGFFNVSFLDGTCIDLFTGCDAVSDFAFDNPTDATTAAQALLGQVFIDSATPLVFFDTVPSLTLGCSTPNQCRALIPYTLIAGPTVTGIAATNAVTEVGDSLSTESRLTTASTTPALALTYAVYSPVSPVPLPPAALLFVSALVGLVGFARRRRQA